MIENSRTKVVVLKQLWERLFDNRTLKERIVISAAREMKELLKYVADDTWRDYLKINHGEKFNTKRNCVFTYRLNSGDRMLFTYGKFVTYFRPEEKNSIVLIDYSKHDDQERVANDFNETRFQEYRFAETVLDKCGLIAKDEDFSAEDFLTAFDVAENARRFQDEGFYYVSDEDLIRESAEDWERMMSDEQFYCRKNYNKSPQPTIFLGSAGTGKSYVGLLLLRDAECEVGTNNIYFTQSEFLIDDLKSQYKMIRSDIDLNFPFQEPKICSLRELCREYIKNSKYSYIKTPDSISNSMGLKKVLESIDLAPENFIAEVRGVIKGSMYSNVVPNKHWARVKIGNQDDQYGDLTNLKDYIVRDAKDIKKFSLRNSIIETREKAVNDISLKRSDKDTLEQIIQYFEENSWENMALSKEEYINLPEEESMVDKKHRALVYDTYVEYVEKKNKKLPYSLYENDVARLMLKKFKLNDLPKFDFIVIDEVQDYTELELFLIFNMAKDPRRIVMAGDSNQIIHPTLFRLSRLQTYFYENALENKFGTKGLTLQPKYLTKNWRCTNEVLGVANTFSEIRRKYIGTQDSESENLLDSKRHSERPIRLEYIQNSSSIDRFLQKIADTPDTVILVATDKSKAEVVAKIDKNMAYVKVHTVAEIKGMEYKYVVCYNLFSDFAKYWKEILTTEQAKKQTKYRYYFNLVYVALTRAQKFVCFVDEEPIQKIEEILKLPVVYEYSDSATFVDKMDTQEDCWFKEALKYNDAGQFIAAAKLFDRLGSNYIEWKNYCMAEHWHLNEDYPKAVRCLLMSEGDLIQGHDWVVRCFKGDMKTPDLQILASLALYMLCEKDEIGFNIKKKKIADIVKKVFPKKEERDLVLRNLHSLIMQRIGMLF